LFERTHGYANLANRAGPIAPDLLLACQDFRIPLKDLQALKQKTSKKKQRMYFSSSHVLSAQYLTVAPKPFVPTLLPARVPSPTPELLSSEDEASGPVITPTLRGLPNYFPELPPKHTYLRTPVCHIGSFPGRD
jgi:transcription initiation factor TFIID subunit 8